ncbi:hypothetical protein MKW94_027768 [Papaver nudicaule]|uniref:Neprosin PEP catalytic domain-containing protein n=1 Tax=Papaver nudicaule TaxID=74823 RepID=A0AA42AZ53_PAPNU|nr:hypothetical protein [Papaver nudicaule]
MGGTLINSLVVVLVLFFILRSINYEVEGRQHISKEEDIELDRQLKILNKPPIKTLHTEFRDVIDCIDIYKQPAFDHPSMKNHKIKGAILKLENGYQKFYGANADISTYQPTVYEDEYSTAHIWVVGNGKNEPLNNIQVGLAVHPTLSGDHRLRMFLYWTADGSYKTGCYNFHCPGYVQIHQYFGPGCVPGNISTYGGRTFINRFFVYQDRKQKVWWLVFTGNRHVGYWPNSIFTGSLSKGFANGLYWGGTTKAGSHAGINPAMGSGHYPNGVSGHSGYFHYAQYVNGFNQIIDLNDTKLDVFVDCEWYKITNDGYTEHGNTIHYGGPGGRCPTY